MEGHPFRTQNLPIRNAASPYLHSSTIDSCVSLRCYDPIAYFYFPKCELELYKRLDAKYNPIRGAGITGFPDAINGQFNR